MICAIQGFLFYGFYIVEMLGLQAVVGKHGKHLCHFFHAIA